MEPEKSQNILIVNKKQQDADFLQNNLHYAGNYSLTVALNGRVAVEIAAKRAFPLIVSDLMLGDLTVSELLTSIKVYSPESQLILISERDSIDLAVDIMRMGAFGFVIKPFSPPHLMQILSRAKTYYDSLIENKRLRAEIKALNIQHAQDVPRACDALSLRETERALIVKTLHECHGNKHLAARRLKIPRSSLYSKIQKHGIRTEEKMSFYSKDKLDNAVLQDIPA